MIYPIDADLSQAKNDSPEQNIMQKQNTITQQEPTEQAQEEFARKLSKIKEIMQMKKWVQKFKEKLSTKKFQQLKKHQFQLIDDKSYYFSPLQ